MTPEIKAFLVDLHADVRDIKDAVLGNEKIKQAGLLARVDRLEKFALLLLLLLAASVGMPRFLEYLKHFT